MPETNKSYRIRTGVGQNLTTDCITVDTTLTQDFDTFEILSLKINAVDTYKLHNSNYGVVVGRVLANNGFGVPNAKVSIFIEADSEQGAELAKIYPYKTTSSKNSGVKYNLLPDEQVGDCHQVVGTFPNKRYMLDNNVVLEMYDKYFTFTTRTNASGDYLIMGVPTGQQTIHMDLDLSDCGVLSQKPRDLVYKGYTIEQFENANKFKDGKDLNSLTQIISMDKVVNVNSFWGNSSLGETIGITRCDMEVSYKFEPTCVFLGSAVSDNSSNGISKKCIPTERMGAMEELVAGKGTIEMIRKTPSDSVEAFEVKGTEVINADGVWCYQIPMNLDYITTDEYGNIIPTDDADKGIPTRARVRFRLSLQDNEENVDNFFRPKVLIPHNPLNSSDGKSHEDYDYEFGTYTAEESYRDLFWNNVYSVKSYIPRFQKRKVLGWKTEKFSGFKGCNYYGSNNPIPYNNIRVRLPFQFRVICAVIKALIAMTGWVNTFISAIGNWLADRTFALKKFRELAQRLRMITLKGGLCPDLENWYFAPMKKNNLEAKNKGDEYYNLLQQTFAGIQEDEDGTKDRQSIDEGTKREGEDNGCLTVKTDYLLSCIEMNLADTYRVINFDFYNDWINGLVYLPRFMRYVKKKMNYRGTTLIRSKVKGCMDDTATFSRSRRFTQMCAVGVKGTTVGNNTFHVISEANTLIGENQNKLGKKLGFKQSKVFGKNGGVCHEKSTLNGQYVYYLKPCEWDSNGKKTILYATDIILLGSLNDCDTHGIPKAFKHLMGTTYTMPTNLAMTNLEEAGTLYATTDGTICSGQQNLGDKKGVEAVSIEKQGLSMELKYFSGSTDADVTYDDESDTIAVTEAAGVSWNWTGPGQGDKVPGKLYYPGGHFLGLACNNAEINVKSCINLERICEAGAEMSQRRESILSVDGAKPTYVYSVPTGLISGDDIADEDFRSMFATMNHKRLLAGKTDADTGYKTYSFNYLHPLNFDGSLYRIASEQEYNKNIEVIEESTDLSKYGITDGKEAGDYDGEETANTQTKTRESHSLDYYMFRYGLNLSNLKANDVAQQNSFLAFEGTYYYLPQYENSYYFYFGLKQGATAIDEFNSQFYANCDSTELISTTPSIELSADLNICKNNCDIKAIIEGIETPYQNIVLYNKDTGENEKEIDGIVDESTGATDEKELQMLYQNEVVLSGVPWGNYKLTVIDSYGNEYSQEIAVGQDLFEIDYTVVSFNGDASNISGATGDIRIFGGGYIKINGIIPQRNNLSATDIAIYPKNEPNKPQKGKASNFPVIINLNETGEHIIKISGKFEDCEFTEITQGSFNVEDNSDIKIYSEWDSNKTDLLRQGDTFAFSGNWWVNYLSANEDTSPLVVPLKRSFFKKNTEDETFNCEIRATNGATLIEWATPQNKSGITTACGVTVCSLDAADAVPGYEVGNSNAYIYTFPILHDSVAQRSAIAVRGNVVAGNYRGTVSGSKITWIDKKYFSGNCGMVFKPLDDAQELAYLIYSSGYSAGTSLSTILGDKNKIGILYPSFVFPTIKRPFKVDADIMIWEYFNNIETDSSVAWNRGVESQLKGGVAKITIYNGITKTVKDEKTYYQFPAFSASFIPEGTSARSNNNDMMGVRNSKDYYDRKTETSGKTVGETFEFSNIKRFNGEFFNDGVGYSITENGGSRLSDSIQQGFYGQIYFYVDNDNKMHLLGKNGNNSAYASYALYTGVTTGSGLSAGYSYVKNSTHWKDYTNNSGYVNDYPYINNGNNNAWACAPFVYTTKSNQDTGTFGIVRIYLADEKKYKYAEYQSVDGSDIKSVDMTNSSWWDGQHSKDTVGICRRFLDAELNNEEIKLIRHRLPRNDESVAKLIDDITGNSSTTGWYDRIENISETYDEDIWKEQHNYFYYVVGKISKDSPNGGKLNFYKVYPTIIQIDNPINWELTPSTGTIFFEPYPVTDNHAKLSLSGMPNAVMDVSISGGSNWITISGDAFSKTDSTVTLNSDGVATLDIVQNSYTAASGAQERNDKLVFSYCGQTMGTVLYKQMPSGQHYATANVSAVSFNQSGGTQIVFVRGDKIEWALSGIPSWCSIEPSAYTGTAGVKITCNSGADNVNRNAKITINTKNTYGKKAEFTITQSGRQYYGVSAETLSLNPTTTGISSSKTIIGKFTATGAAGTILKISNWDVPSIGITQTNFINDSNQVLVNYSLSIYNGKAGTTVIATAQTTGNKTNEKIEWAKVGNPFSVSAYTEYGVYLTAELHNGYTTTTVLPSLTAQTANNNRLYFDVE